jgi:EAL domain-containing protein (putative c-di-GMP-specific phosphodiesterase class I)
MPNDFISILEKSGHLKEIGFIMIEKVISQIAIWKKEYNKDVRVSFNISESSLRSFDFTDRVIELLDEHKVSPTNLSIELVEQLIDDKNEIISVNLQKFRDKGIIISIDDFGVAYSNLLRITDFDYDVLKIDKKFTNVVDRNDTSVILEMIRKLTDIKGCTCVAEGVETKAQLLKLKELGITKIQGFYFSVPLQVSDATKWLLKE